MAYEKIARLISKLAKRTEDGKISWEQTETKGIYQAAFPGYSIRLRKEASESEYGNYSVDIALAVFDSQGEIIEEVKDPDLGEALGNAFTVMSNLYDQARRQAMGVEQALDALLEELTDDDDVPF